VMHVTVAHGLLQACKGCEMHCCQLYRCPHGIFN
jgi:hypothetical protein